MKQSPVAILREGTALYTFGVKMLSEAVAFARSPSAEQTADRQKRVVDAARDFVSRDEQLRPQLAKAAGSVRPSSPRQLRRALDECRKAQARCQRLMSEWMAAASNYGSG